MFLVLTFSRLSRYLNTMYCAFAVTSHQTIMKVQKGSTTFGTLLGDVTGGVSVFGRLDFGRNLQFVAVLPASVLVQE